MKILTIFTESKEEKDRKAAERAARALVRGQGALTDRLEAERDALQDELDKLLNLKVGKVSSSWNEDFHKAKVNLALKVAEIDIAKATTEEYFTEEYFTEETKA